MDEREARMDEKRGVYKWEEDEGSACGGVETPRWGHARWGGGAHAWWKGCVRLEEGVHAWEGGAYAWEGGRARIEGGPHLTPREHNRAPKGHI
jgi:hypothetical protein